jgi:hypothetical protein
VFHASVPEALICGDAAGRKPSRPAATPLASPTDGGAEALLHDERY